MAAVAISVGKVRESRMKKTELPVFVKLEAVCDPTMGMPGGS